MIYQYLFEFIGTAILILLGNGVVANVSLKSTYGNNAGLIVITFGWAIGVFVGVFVSADASGAHLNPAVTLGLATAGKFSWQMVPGYVLAQVLGAMMGSILVWLTYKKHYDTTEDPGAIRGTFSTGPAIDKPLWNFITELIGTFVLVFAVFYIAGGTLGDEPISLGSLDALPVGLVVLGIGLSLGGPTGYAINPARDLGPRIMHALLPIKAKGDSNWKYAWIPVLGPITGGVLAAVVYMAISM
jgi:glycerol uptake facilitator protein